MMITRLARSFVNNRLIAILTIALSYLAKFVLYRFEVGLDKGLHPWQIIGAYVLLTGASMVLACIGMRRNRLWAVLSLMVVMDLWMIANSLYFYSNFSLLDWQVMLVAGNLRGFEDSILAYVRWWMFVLPLVTAATATFLIRFRKELAEEETNSRSLALVVCTGAVVYLVGLGLGHMGTYLASKDPTQPWYFNETKRAYTQRHSPAGHLVWVVYEGMKEWVLHLKAIIPLTDKEQRLLQRAMTDAVTPATPKGHLVYLLVESWESWTLQARDLDGVEVCEQINRYMRDHNLLVCTEVYSQQKYGRSGDGQLITQTGMLPLSSGVTCMKYGDNVYPNLAHFYPNSVVLNPYPGVWNQHTTTYSYGFQRLRETERMRRRKGTDSLMIDWTIEELRQAEEPTCVLALTISMHAPFTDVRPTLRFGDKYSSIEANYLQTVHYMDRHVGRFLAWADTAAVMRDATIVITADHNHFERAQGKGLCPLLIQSPTIDRPIYIPQAYQMDLFPTVLHAIGQHNYAWHGFGVDWLGADHHRNFTEEQAYALSDKMLRTNYFRSSVIDSIR